MKPVATVGFRDIDDNDRLARFPETLKNMGFTYQQRVGYKCWKVPSRRRNWMQWNDGGMPLRIRFCNDQGEMRTWKLFARVDKELQLPWPWEKPEEYKRGTAKWMPAGSDVWGCSYEALQEYLAKSTSQQLLALLTEDLKRSHKYSSQRYG